MSDLTDGQVEQALERWLELKLIETNAKRERQQCEDYLSAWAGLKQSDEGARTLDLANYKVSITQRMSRKVNGDVLQEIAKANGLSDHLSTLFRWKPEIDAKAWKNASAKITEPLLDAITTTPGRPSYKITEKDI